MDNRLWDFREHLRRTLGRYSLEFIALRQAGWTTWQISMQRAKFVRLGRWRVRRLLRAIRDEAIMYARQTGDDGIVLAVESVLRRKQKPANR